jgi:Fe(3+) dicitrate transport protein
LASGRHGRAAQPNLFANNPKETHNLMVGGTADNGFGSALLYSGTRGSDWREHSATRIDDDAEKQICAERSAHL